LSLRDLLRDFSGTIRDCNFYGTLGTPDRQMVQIAGVEGPVTIDSCHIGFGNTNRPLIAIYGGLNANPPPAQETYAANGPGTINVTNNSFDSYNSDTEDPIVVLTNVPFILNRYGNMGTNSTGSSADLPNEPSVQPEAYIIPVFGNTNVGPYSLPTRIQAWRASIFEIVPTNGNPFTLGNPESCRGDEMYTNSPPSYTHHQKGRRITIKIKNTTSAQLGTITWGNPPLYKLAPWTNPAPGFQRSITFRWDGSYWYEETRTPADVSNTAAVAPERATLKQGTAGNHGVLKLWDPVASAFKYLCVDNGALTLSDTEPT